jgi:hypothetical protein
MSASVDDETPEEPWPPVVDFPTILDDNNLLSVSIVHFCRDDRFGCTLWDIGSSALIKLGEAPFASRPGYRFTPALASLRTINRLWASTFERLTCHRCGACAYLGLFRRFYVEKCHAHFCLQCCRVQGRVTTRHILCRPCWTRQDEDYEESSD